MGRKKDEPAFPRAGFSGPGGFGRPDNGMSLRDYFAGQALAGLSASPTMRQIWDASDMARQSYAFANAMLAAREDTTT